MIYFYTAGIAWAAYMLGYTVAKIRMENTIWMLAKEQREQKTQDIWGE